MIPRSRMTARAPAAWRCWGPAGLILVLALVAFVQGETPPPGPSLEEMKQLIEDLGDDQYGVREEATKRLLAIGPPALPLLENATESPDPEVSQRAWRIIDYHAANGCVPALLYQLSCSNAPLRASAAESLGKLEAKAQAALPNLIKATTDQTDYVRCSAQEAIKKIQATLPLRVEIKHSTEAIDLNGETFFRIEVSNQGKTAMKGICILAQVPEQLTLTSVQGPVKHRQEGRQVSCEPFTLEAGASCFCEVHVKAQRPGIAPLKVEVKASSLEAPLLGEGAVLVNPGTGQ